jgi:hypothetical protein
MTSTIRGGDNFDTSPTKSMVRLNTANGCGSTNTMIRRFTNTVTNQGSDITYADSATLGATFTINTSGVYAISYTDFYSAAFTVGLSLNATQLTTAVQSQTDKATILAVSTTAANGYGGNPSWTGYLPSGSVVRPHIDTAGAASGAAAQFTLVKVAN